MSQSILRVASLACLLLVSTSVLVAQETGAESSKPAAPAEEGIALKRGFAFLDQFELTEEQEQKVAEIKKKWAPRFAAAQSRYESVMKQVDENDVPKWRAGFRKDLAATGLSGVELEKAVEEQIQERRSPFDRFARRDLVNLQVQLQPTLQRLLTREQLFKKRPISEAELKKYVSSSELFKAAFAIPEDVELSDELKERLAAMRDKWAPRFAAAEKHRDKQMEGVNAQSDEWLVGIRKDLKRAGLSGEELEKEAAAQLKKQRDKFEQFASKQLITVRVQLVPELQSIIRAAREAKAKEEKDKKAKTAEKKKEEKKAVASDQPAKPAEKKSEEKKSQ